MSVHAELVELRYTESTTNSNKFYRVYFISDDEAKGGRGDYRVLFQWGRWGSKGQGKVETYANRDRMVEAGERKLGEKRLKGGYITVRDEKLSIVPDDVLQAAFDTVDANVRSQQQAQVQVDDFGRFSAGADKLIRVLTGPSELTGEAVVMHSTLKDQLAKLRARLQQAEGSLELIEDVLAMKASA